MSAKKCWCDAMILLFTSAIVSPFVERLKKPTGILNFKGPRERGENLYKELKRDKVRNIITIANCIWSTTKKASRKFQWLFLLWTPNYIITILEVTNLPFQINVNTIMDQTPSH